MLVILSFRIEYVWKLSEVFARTILVMFWVFHVEIVILPLDLVRIVSIIAIVEPDITLSFSGDFCHEMDLLAFLNINVLPAYFFQIDQKGIFEEIIWLRFFQHFLWDINRVFWGVCRINFDLKRESKILLLILIQPTEAHKCDVWFRNHANCIPVGLANVEITVVFELWEASPLFPWYSPTEKNKLAALRYKALQKGVIPFYYLSFIEDRKPSWFLCWNHFSHVQYFVCQRDS